MAKKSFKDALQPTTGANPALQFISSAPHPEAAEPTTSRARPGRTEAKSARVQLLIQPSLKAKLLDRAYAEGRSLNDTIHNILAEAVKGD